MSASIALSPDAILAMENASRVMARWLIHVVDAPVVIWQGGGPWQCVGLWRREKGDEDRHESVLRFDTSDTLADYATLSAIGDLLDEHITSRTAPRAVQIDDRRQCSVIPIGSLSADLPPLVMTALADDDTAQIVCQLAEIEFERNDFAQRHDQLQDEFDICTAQISDNFEELAFLRSISEALESADLTSGLTEMASGVLPNLRVAIKAQEVVLFLAKKNGDRRGATMFRCEPTDLSDEVCTRLLSVFRPEDPKSPIIRNDCNVGENSNEFPGVNSFILVPVSKSGHVMGWLMAINRAYRAGFEDANFLSHLSNHEFGSEEAGLVSSAASMLASHSYNCEQYRQREELLIKVVRTLVCAIETKDPYTCGHSERVALFARRLAQAVGLTDEACERIYLSGLLHDVGKIGISDATLQKPDKLTAEEYEEIKQHPDFGWDILCDLTELKQILAGVVHHHERIDGKGYPDGLVADSIPLDGRIMAVADAFDAMTSSRSYRKGMPNETAISILREGAGEQWDASFVAEFLEIFPDIEKIQKSYDRPPHRRRTAPVRQVEE